MDNYIITIARSFGSGGKEIASLLSEKLGIPWYERQILTMASQASGIDESEFVEVDEKLHGSYLIKSLTKLPTANVLRPESRAFVSDLNLYNIQAAIIEELSHTQSCIIVGKCADHILRDKPNVLSVFVDAYYDDCISKIRSRIYVSEERAKDMKKRTDKYRTAYYKYYTRGENWKDSLIVGTLMNTRGLMQLVALNIGFEMGILSAQMFVVLLIMSLLTTFMATPMLSLVEKIFAKQEEKAHHHEKVLLSFGRPETGRTLLGMADLLLGHRLQNSQLIATHFTLGTDLNPAKAEEFAEESFIPLREEARHLNLQVDERYQVTDKLIQEMIHVAKKEHVDYLFVGAGQQFMQDNSTAPGKLGKRFTTIARWLKQLKDRPLHLPGTLLRQKLESIMDHVDCSVGIFVNRGFTQASNILLLVDSEDDLFLFNYARTRLGEQSMTIRICFINGQVDKQLESRIMNDFVQIDPHKFVLDKPLTMNTFIENKETLLVMSYTTCEKLSKDQELFAKLPSLLIIRPKQIEFKV